MAGLFYSILSKSSCTAASEEKETLMAHLMKVKADNGTSLQRLGDRIWMDLVPAKHFYTERRSIHPHSPSFHPTEVGQIFEKGPLTCLQWSDQTLIQWYFFV